MKLTINQTLHGYQSGHQLLASSVEISAVDRNTVLFQSDLSGSMVETGFDTYITGYPIKDSTMYVFARTWYASEMERPGCVWTHSLLLDFADVGKIPEFENLDKLFRRPKLNSYQEYESKIEVELDELIEDRSLIDINLSPDRVAILVALYDHPKKTILVPAKSSKIFERDILRTWSDQWPRLRRSFTFSSGALSIRTLNNIEYNLQVVPEESVSSISRKTKKGYIIDRAEESNEGWLGVLRKFPKQKIREFLWSNGSDIDGDRENYVSLLLLFEVVNRRNYSLQAVIDCINNRFPKPHQGKFLKKNLFGSNSILPMEEKDLLEILVNSDEISAIDRESLQITERIAELVNEDKLSYSELASLMKNDYSNLIHPSIWDRVASSREGVIELIRENEELIEVFLTKSTEFTTYYATWQLPMHVQRRLVNSLVDYDANLSWEKIVRAMLQAGTKIISELKSYLGETAIATSLDWLSESKENHLNDSWANSLSKETYLMRKWIIQNPIKINTNIFKFLFDNMSNGALAELGLDGKSLANGYDLVCQHERGNYRNVLAARLYGIALQNSIRNCSYLIEKLFPVLYQQIIDSRLKDEIWKYIKKEPPVYDEDDYGIFTAWVSYWGSNKKKKFDVAYWDYGRQLIVTTINNFIRHSWPASSFVNAFINKQELKDACTYCLTFERGNKFLKRIIYEVEQGRAKINHSQKQYFSKYFDY